MRDYRLYLDDINNAIKSIEKYTKGLDFNNFKKNDLVINATLRQLEVIGEAVKNIPNNIKSQASDIEWKKVAGLRDILIHEYFGVDIEIIWDVVKNNVPALKKAVKKLEIK